MRKKDNSRTRGLKKCPHVRGWVHRLSIVTPKKPNSARRPVVKALLKRKIRPTRLTAHIPGIGHTLKKFGKILLRGRGPRDLPGVRYSLVRGVLDFLGLRNKRRRRSIYGAAQNDLSKIRAKRKYRVAIRKAENDRVHKEFLEKIIEQEPIIKNNFRFINNFLTEDAVYYTYVNKNFNFFKKKIEIKNFLVLTDKLLPIDKITFQEFLDFQKLTTIINFYTFFFFKNKLKLLLVLFFFKNFIFFKKNMSKMNINIALNNVNVLVKTYFNNKLYFIFYNYNQSLFYLQLDKYSQNFKKSFQHPERLLKCLLYQKKSFVDLKKKLNSRRNSFLTLRKVFRTNFNKNEIFFFYTYIHTVFKDFFFLKKFEKIAHNFFNKSLYKKKKINFFFFKNCILQKKILKKKIRFL